MQIDKKTNEIEPCECGYKPQHYSIGYGSTPYYISCLGCGKSLHNGTNDPGIIISQWNNDYRHRKQRGQLMHLPPNVQSERRADTAGRTEGK
ncbi:MAG: hypothetical protein AAB538_02535, partial [Patescibacteria group bacterium]